MATDEGARDPAAGDQPAAGIGAEAASSAADVDVSQNEGEQGADGGTVEHDLDELLEATRRERDEYLALAQRARADFENFRRRAAIQATEAELRGRSELAKGLIPVVDNLERALLAAGITIDPEARAREAADHPSEEVSAHEALGRGVAMVLGELQAALARAGVEAFDPNGETFDPATSEALSMRPATDGEAGKVVETLEKGYRLEERVLRPARVIVGT